MKLYLIILLFLISIHTEAQIIKTVTSSGRAEGTGPKAEALAKYGAYRKAIEQAVGVNITSSVVISEGMLKGDFLKTMSRGLNT